MAISWREFNALPTFVLRMFGFLLQRWVFCQVLQNMLLTLAGSHIDTISFLLVYREQCWLFLFVLLRVTHMELIDDSKISSPWDILTWVVLRASDSWVLELSALFLACVSLNCSCSVIARLQKGDQNSKLTQEGIKYFSAYCYNSSHTVQFRNKKMLKPRENKWKKTLGYRQCPEAPETSCPLASEERIWVGKREGSQFITRVNWEYVDGFTYL